jgi:hypothetical protein
VVVDGGEQKKDEKVMGWGVQSGGAGYIAFK